MNVLCSRSNRKSYFIRKVLEHINTFYFSISYLYDVTKKINPHSNARRANGRSKCLEKYLKRHLAVRCHQT